MNLIDFHSHLWETYRGAYGNVKDDIVILTNKKQLFIKRMNVQNIILLSIIYLKI